MNAVVTRYVPSRQRQLGILVSGLSLTSLGAFVGDAFGLYDMDFILAFLVLPSVIFIVGLTRWAVHKEYSVYTRRLVLGAWIGLTATLAYDAIRLVAQNALPVHFNAFAIIPKFGELITHQPETATAAILVGWAYHFSNGITFALCFALTAGPIRWWYGVLYGLVLEACMIAVYPSAFGLAPGAYDFLAISIIGHACYGLVVGVLNERFNFPDKMEGRAQ